MESHLRISWHSLDMSRTGCYFIYLFYTVFAHPDDRNVMYLKYNLTVIVVGMDRMPKRVLP